ncbi:hypothetical protein C8R45DRAFT_1112510 [Mycena sanguinolenta]|nr:hypothetical protein C8R45DRAFT_1112510 [Mycena sanguinolenta]
MSDPFLPPELEHGIFKLVALTHPKMIPILMVEPLLYRAIIVTFAFPEREPLSYLMLSARRLLGIIRAKPPEFLQNSVQDLFINTRIHGQEITAVYTACNRVTSLVDYSSGSLQNPTFGELSHLRRVTLTLEDFLNHPSRAIEHLEQPQPDETHTLPPTRTLPDPHRASLRRP